MHSLPTPATSIVIIIIITIVVVLGSTSCPTPIDRGLDLEAPRLVSTSLPDGEEVSPTPTVELRFSEPLAPQSVSDATVIIVPFEVLQSCATGQPCTSGHCHHDRCQSDPVGASWLQDLAHPPLGPPHAAQAVRLGVRLDESGTVVTATPLVPLDPHRLHTLLLSPAITDVAGNPLWREPGQEVPLRQVFATAAAELGRPMLSLRSPLDGATEVPMNLTRVVVQSSKPVGGVHAGSLWLELATGERIPAAVSPSTLCEQAASCFELRPLQLLPPLQALAVRVDASVRDSSGRPILEPRASFTTGLGVDRSPPEAQALLVQEADACIVVRLRTAEPTDLTLIPSWGTPRVASVGCTDHEVAVRAPVAESGTLELQLQDVAGNRAQLPARLVAPSSPSLAITEVLANPAGPEPAQELVELQNVGADPVDLAGWVLDDNDDSIGANELPAVVLQPGQLAVVIGHGYSLSSLADPPPAPGSVLVRLATTLGEDGLANTGERITLRDPKGRLVSAYGSHYSVADKSSNGRSVERLAPAGCDVRANWRPNPEGRSTPGAPARP